MSTRPLFLTLLTAIVFSPAALNAADDSKMIVRVYPVGNLVRSVPDYPYRSGLPTTDSGQTSSRGTSRGTAASGQSVGGFGGGGLGGGGAGGGFFQIGNVPPGMVADFGGQNESSSETAIDIRELIGVIQSTIAPMTWTNSGGDGTIVSIGHSLVVRQTEEVLDEIDALIQALSQQSDNQTMVTVEAYLLTVKPDREIDMGKLRALTVNPDGTVVQSLRETGTKIGQITSFSGQQVFLASGEVRNIVKSLIPVVSAVAVGYQPVVEYPHIGALLELRTTIDPGELNNATLDVRCTLTEWQDAGDPIRVVSEFGPGKASEKYESSGGRSEGTIDRVNINTQQLATTVRVPVTADNEPPLPVLIGSLGSTSSEDSDAEGDADRTYLVVIVTRP